MPEYTMAPVTIAHLCEALAARTGAPAYLTSTPILRPAGALSLDVEITRHETDPLLVRRRFCVVQHRADGSEVPITPWEDAARTLGLIHALAGVEHV